MAAATAMAAGAIPRFIPSESALGPLARILDSLAPWILSVAILFGLLAAVSGARWLGSALGLAAALCIAQIIFEHRGLSLPKTQSADREARVLFFNVRFENASHSDRIVTEALKFDPDVVVFAEASAMYSSFARLRENFAFVSPCAFEDCEILIASKRKPLRTWQLNLNPAWPDRYAVSRFETDSGKKYFLAVSHIAKPWLSGISEPEYERLAAQYDWLAGPVVAIGDFNSAPWSLPMRDLLKRTGMRALRWPLATWPAKAGRFGVPIDHVLVHEGARVVRISPFGSTQNSNHRGFVVDIALP